jgi:general stress protein YciG
MNGPPAWPISSPTLEEVNPVAGKDKGGMSVSEAGKRGGEKTASTHGHEFYENIGKKGGQTTSEKYGTPFYEEIGHKGGQKVKKLIEEGKKARK